MKRGITLLLALALCAGLVALPASAAGKVKDPRHIATSCAVVDADGVLWMSEASGRIPKNAGKAQNGFVRVMDNVVSIIDGERTTAVIKTDGSLWTWGSSAGNGTKEGSEVPVKIMDDVVDFDCSRYRGAIVKSDGSLYIWDSYPWNEERFCPSPVKFMDNVVSVRIGDYGGSVIKTDGGLYTWGSNNDYGTLGNGTTEPSETPTKILDDVVQTRGCFAVKSNGELWGWGDCYDCILGIEWEGNDRSFGNAPIQTVPIRIMDGVKRVEPSGTASFVIKEDNSLWVWGNNTWKKMGIGDKEVEAQLPIKLMDDVAEICTGVASTIAAKTDGSVWTWGVNSSGELGYQGGDKKGVWNMQPSDYQTVPRQVPGMTVAASAKPETKPETKPEPKPEPVKDPVKTPAARPSRKKGFTSSEKLTVWFDMTRESDVGVLYDIIVSNDSDKRVEDYYCVVTKTTNGTYFCAFLNLALDPGACVKKNQNMGDWDLEEKIADIAWIRFDDAADRTSFVKDYGIKWFHEENTDFNSSDYSFMTNEDIAASLFRH